MRQLKESRRRLLASLKATAAFAVLSSAGMRMRAAPTNGTNAVRAPAVPAAFGAIADGLSHPLSTRFATLAAARAVYPFASGLHHEIDWCAIQAAIISGTPVRLAAGHYRIDDTLRLKSGSTLVGAGDATVLQWTKPVLGTVFSIFAAERVAGFRLENFSVVDSSGSMTGYVLAGYNVKQASVARLSAKGIAIAAFLPAREADDKYHRVTIEPSDAAFNGSAYLSVTGCTAEDVASSPDARAAVLFRYCVHWSVTDCSFANVPFGVQWWGGDSDPAVDGAIGNRRKCIDGKVTNVKAVNCIAGVWGSMGDDVHVVRCEVDAASDVGIDFEGCVDCSASQNRVSHCKNGNLTIFWWNVGISFVENLSRQARADYPHVRVYNAAQDIENRSLIVKSNKFSTEGAIGVIDTSSGCVESLTFEGNELLDTRINFVANNLRYVNVMSNSTVFTRPLLPPYYAMQIGQLHNGGRAVVAANTLVMTVDQRSLSIAIYLWSDDYNSDAKFTVVDNSIQGFRISLATDNFGRNPGKTSIFMIENNDFGSGVYRKLDHGSRASQSFLRGNRP
ncbi:conserved exported hypothetical protein [Burkholderia sp. 8Y]|uniref:hypothetical protein n=1 Tax=Burkholderia sp. 8Y TaxID=2653133 RepID=UPI0012F05D52|nr:hypothetical protein [Burkholderia sp. 8Y]VXC16732.1 conserved exported hypothetical protein [Burkholderia sp. 8Y]